MIVAWDAQHLQLFLSFLDSSFVVLVFSYFTNSCLQSFSITRFFCRLKFSPNQNKENNQLTYQYYVCMSKMHQVTTRWRLKIFASKCQVETSKNWQLLLIVFRKDKIKLNFHKLEFCLQIFWDSRNLWLYL